MKKKKKQNQTKAKAIDPEQKIGWTWTDSKDRTSGHMMRWIRRRMIDRAETNRSTTKPDPEET
jgi:hypothetical protein